MNIAGRKEQPGLTPDDRETVVIRRRVLHFGGYDPMSPETFHARFRRELTRFASCWGVRAEATPLACVGSMASWTVTVAGAGWRVETRHDLIRWDDLIAAQRRAGVWPRLRGGLAAGFDFVRYGALGGYLANAWRYAAFFLYPYFALAGVLLIGLLAGLAASVLGGPGWLSVLLGLLLAAAGLWRAAGHSHIGHLLDDWIFARKVVRGFEPSLAQRLSAAAGEVSATPADRHVLVVGHSLGAVLAAQMLDEAAGPGCNARAVTWLTIGSSILKIALHRQASGLRAQLGLIATAPSVAWIEYQAISDVMNFFRTDPVAVLGINGRSPVVRKVRFGQMLNREYYASIRFNFFRLHCQFISANDKRAPYDYVMMICGPFDPVALAASRDGAMGWIGTQGDLTQAGLASLLPAADRSTIGETATGPL
ncbi:MAG: hypothetical protein NTZ14_03025 [Hyphomicrobiales bacterium]|nr:hypothetical protein [Hyphomicrobiales bacterium]